jgi:hypothetical protein
MPIQLHHEDDATYRMDVTGRLGRDEYVVCEGEMTAAIKDRGSVKLLCVLRDFEGWETHPGWSDLSFYSKSADAITRIAIVGAEKWRDEALLFAAAGLRPAPVEFFTESNLAQARTWLSAGSPVHAAPERP